jgi:DMSO/TMAO reductase YedYZ heme-binding membrane subunit
VTEIPWTWFAIRASGITAWGLLTAVVLWGILLRTRLLGRLASPMRLLDLHRWLGATALAFLLIHMILLLVDPAVKFTVAQLLIPGLAPWQPLAVSLGIIAFWLLIPVSIMGRLRPRLGKVGNTWFKQSHLIAYAAWPLATAHYVLAGTDALSEWSIALIIAGSALLVFGLLARGFVPAPAPARPVRS